jgi:hypothetical protein
MELNLPKDTNKALIWASKNRHLYCILLFLLDKK